MDSNSLTLSNFTSKDSTPRKLLRSLETVNYLYSHLKKLDQAKKPVALAPVVAAPAASAAATVPATDSPVPAADPPPIVDKEKEKENDQKEKSAKEAQAAAEKEKETEDEEQRMKMSLVDGLRPLWEDLSKCLITLENMPDYQHAVFGLQNAAEAFFLCYSLVMPTTKVPSADQPPTDRSGIATSSAAAEQVSSASEMNPEEQNQYQKEMFAFAEKHRSVLNQILRGNTHSLEGSAFAILTHFPRILDFDVKRKYFYKELKKIDSRDRNRFRSEDIAIHVRRSHIFGDSYRELHRLRPVDWKARFYIIFEGEEGQDAGGLLREWYQVITREIFNPNYALFINAPGDRVTYMINKSSYVNPEHLDYFRFVGRLIAKAIYDNKQLDCYFTRAFYKHILNIHVRYQDIESEDPEIFKSLEFLLTNSVNDLGSELTFSVEVEEFGVHSTRQLKEGGAKLIVTDANKTEYVHLMCQMKMTGSIRQQLNAFLEGFYDLIPKKLIAIFNEQELELLISGLPEINVDDLCANTEYKNYTRTSQHIQWFWRALRSFEQADKAKFLQFVTGTSKVPLQGFANLEGMNGIQKFTLQKDTRSFDRLPSAHTCFNQLDLPEYPDYETLHKMLLLACRECSEGFGFA